jgi:hypothetical protein
MWTLEYEGEKDIPYDEPTELDPKMAMSWPRDFNKLEAIRLRKPASGVPQFNTDVSSNSSNTIPI